MDLVTLFVRDTTEAFAPPCDVADRPVFDAAGAPAGFVGAAWGEHTADSALHQAVCHVDETGSVLASWGLHLAPPLVDATVDTTVQDIALDPVAPDPVALPATTEKEGWVDYID